MPCGTAVERREAPPSYVTGGRERLASVPGRVSQARPGGRCPPAPPGAPSPYLGNGKRGYRRARAAKNRAGGALPGRTAMKFGIGQPITRKEDEALLRGAGRYVADHAPRPTQERLVLFAGDGLAGARG